MGDRLHLGAGAVGSVLAAVGTALPETMIPVVAILGALIVGSGSAAAGEIGIGAILGAPFLLATLALFVVGAAALGYKRRRQTGSEITAGIIALILAPLATELPEKFNSVIWLRDNKDTLAIGNITGAMVFQSTIPVSIGVLFTPWQLDFLSAFASALAILSSVVFLGFLLRKAPLRAFHMLGAGSLYMVFVVTAVVCLIGG